MPAVLCTCAMLFAFSEQGVEEESGKLSLPFHRFIPMNLKS
jgi:hypothetical protein